VDNERATFSHISNRKQKPRRSRILSRGLPQLLSRYVMLHWHRYHADGIQLVNRGFAFGS
jgi:hypothetical protein